MRHQGLMGRDTRIPATPVDFHSMVAARKSPGILILNEFGDVLHLNDTAWGKHCRSCVSMEHCRRTD